MSGAEDPFTGMRTATDKTEMGILHFHFKNEKTPVMPPTKFACFPICHLILPAAVSSRSEPDRLSPAVSLQNTNKPKLLCR